MDVNYHLETSTTLECTKAAQAGMLDTIFSLASMNKHSSADLQRSGESLLLNNHIRNSLQETNHPRRFLIVDTLRTTQANDMTNEIHNRVFLKIYNAPRTS